jgi:ectoine hydroxylase-related dioxygenase (phytanoyl-CoA dioxygenase family)
MADMDFVHCPTKPGDVVFFDCYVPHASEPNLTNKIRRMYFATYNRLSEGYHLDRYYADKYKNFPPDIERVPGKEYVFRV